MATFKIKWAEKKTSQTGKEYTTAVVSDEQGAEHQVSIWPDFVDYAKIVEGAVEGVIQTKGQYKNLVSGNLGAKPAAFQRKENQINKAMDKKAEAIKKAQENKELGIMTSATMRDAVSLAIAQLQGNPFTAEEMKDCIEFWRDYLIENWSVDIRDYADPIK